MRASRGNLLSSRSKNSKIRYADLKRAGLAYLKVWSGFKKLNYFQFKFHYPAAA